MSFQELSDTIHMLEQKLQAAISAELRRELRGVLNHFREMRRDHIHELLTQRIA